MRERLLSDHKQKVLERSHKQEDRVAAPTTTRSTPKTTQAGDTVLEALAERNLADAREVDEDLPGVLVHLRRCRALAQRSRNTALAADACRRLSSVYAEIAAAAGGTSAYGGVGGGDGDGGDGGGGRGRERGGRGRGGGGGALPQAEEGEKDGDGGIRKGHPETAPLPQIEVGRSVGRLFCRARRYS